MDIHTEANFNNIIQGSANGLAPYVVNAADLKSITASNELCKYLDDTYLIIPASNVDSMTTELDNIQSWSRDNNLSLNLKKSVEIIFVNSSRRRQVPLPSLITGISRVSSLKILGVTVTSQISVSKQLYSLNEKKLHF